MIHRGADKEAGGREAEAAVDLVSRLAADLRVPDRHEDLRAAFEFCHAVLVIARRRRRHQNSGAENKPYRGLFGILVENAPHSLVGTLPFEVGRSDNRTVFPAFRTNSFDRGSDTGWLRRRAGR